MNYKIRMQYRMQSIYYGTNIIYKLLQQKNNSVFNFNLFFVMHIWSNRSLTPLETC